MLRPSRESEIIHRLLHCVLVLFAATALACASAPPRLVLAESLRGEGLRTLVVEDAFTLHSPYDASRTAELARSVAENLQAVSAFYGVEFERPVIALALPLELPTLDARADADSLHLSGSAALPTLHGVRGFVTDSLGDDAPAFGFFVAADRQVELEPGRVVTLTFAFDSGPTIRHELAHLCALRAGLHGPHWFDEAVAMEAASARPEHGRLVPDARVPTLKLAATALADHDLADLLDWTEDGNAIAVGDEQPFLEGRPMAQAYLRFLLEHLALDDPLAAYGRVLDMSRDQHLALEPAWRDWLGTRASEAPAAAAEPAGQDA